MIVMPAIHEFPEPEGRAWGWHRTKDLARAVNNLLGGQRSKLHLSSVEVVERFMALSSMTHGGWLISGVVWTHSGKIRRLRNVTCRDEFSERFRSFVPAGWGVAVIKAVRQGAVRAESLWDISKEKYLYIGVREDHTRFYTKGV